MTIDHRQALSIMLQGTASDVGKSLLVAGLCRIFAQDGYRVAPFKSQNMALNSGITAKGDEMGRAQIFQAEAAGVAADVRMNPVLLKPTSDCNAQVIVMGKVFSHMDAVGYHEFKPQLMQQIEEVYRQLATEFEVIVLEGAGSPAEINLRSRDIVNMGMAERVNAPVLIVADIDKGGVFASIYGTLALLSDDERARVKGVIINKFRGDVALLQSGIDMIEQMTKVPVVGVMPFIDIQLEDEDGVALEKNKYRQYQFTPANCLDIAVLHLPHIANFSDLNPLQIQPGVHLRYVMPGEAIGEPDLLVIPGSKNTLGDLRYLYQTGLAGQITQFHQSGKPIIGICGGYQMLGKMLYDGVESDIPCMPGLGLLDCETHFAVSKVTTQVSATILAHEETGLLAECHSLSLTGYEIHMGQTQLGPEAKPFCQLNSRNLQTLALDDGAVNPQGNVIGSYIHGLFDQREFTSTLLNNLRRQKGLPPIEQIISFTDFKQQEYDRLAKSMREHIDIPRIYQIMREANSAGELL